MVLARIALVRVPASTVPPRPLPEEPDAHSGASGSARGGTDGRRELLARRRPLHEARDGR
jgi:hypothetical protein